MGTFWGRKGLIKVVLSCLLSEENRGLGGGLWVKVSEGRVHVVGEYLLDGGKDVGAVIFLPHFLLQNFVCFLLFREELGPRHGRVGDILKVLWIEPFDITSISRIAQTHASGSRYLRGVSCPSRGSM
jgi:hypothetical protein